MGKGKHFIGDFLPPEELEKFMETFKALKVSFPLNSLLESNMEKKVCFSGIIFIRGNITKRVLFKVQYEMLNPVLMTFRQ